MARPEDDPSLLRWLDSFDELAAERGPGFAARALRTLGTRAGRHGVEVPGSFSGTPYVNTVAAATEPPFPGDLQLERRLEGLVRWNAAAMVIRANRRAPGLGGHLSTYMSTSTLFEVGFNHFFRGRDHPEVSDQVFFQGHASPGVYARAFLEGRLDRSRLERFRREVEPGRPGLSSYPHPWLMPSFWEFSTVSMGLSPTQAVHQARFNRYLEARSLLERSGRVWAFVGDGEMDEPESVGSLRLAARERLDNLTFVVNCNLQRLDGPVRGNGKIVQELERTFAGAGWKVVKLLWGTGWDPLFERDVDGDVVARLGSLVDGDVQNWSVRGGDFMHQQLFGDRRSELTEAFDAAALERLEFGGHDLRKVHAAFTAATRTEGRPTVVLAQTVKGHGLGSGHEARNVTHKSTDLTDDELLAFRDRCEVPLDDEAAKRAEFVAPSIGSPEMRVLHERRRALGGPVPERRTQATGVPVPPRETFQRFRSGTGERTATTTVCTVRLLGDLLRDEDLGPRIVPIVPDEARTFGLEALFPRIGIYAAEDPDYTPVDADSLLSYDESTEGQLLEEGITEAGALGSAIAAGTSYATHGLVTVPFYFFYSMFGFQRVGDLLWAAGDARARGFLIGCTAGRTTLDGEGLQHQDGHSHLLARAWPHVRAYDPAFGYEVETLVRHGLRRILEDERDELYYLTTYNEARQMPAAPAGADEGIVRGMYQVAAGGDEEPDGGDVALLASGPMVFEALEAKRVLEDTFGVDATVYSVTSWTGLHRDAAAVARRRMLEPGTDVEASWIEHLLGPRPGPTVGVSDYVRAVPDLLAGWLGPHHVNLGTDGFGRSGTRAELRRLFRVDAPHIAFAALTSLAGAGALDPDRLPGARAELGVDPGAVDPTVS